MYKLIVEWNGKSWCMEEYDDEVMVYLSVASYSRSVRERGRSYMRSFFIEKDGVMKKIDYKKALDVWDPKNRVD